MGFLQDIVHAITGGGGHPQQTLVDGHPAMKSNFQPMQPMQMKPQMGINGQPMPMQQHMSVPQAPQMPQLHGQIGQQHGMASNYSTPIQGRQNPGFIPMQNSGVGMVGNGINVGYTQGLQPNIGVMGSGITANPQLQGNETF